MSGQEAPKPGALDLDSSRGEGGLVTLTLRGELDLAGVPGLEERLAEIEQEGVERIAIDISALSFIDSSGLRVLLLADGRARERGHELLLTQPTEPVRRVLEMTGALDLLRFRT
ncbi:MAG TPA: STAS domain-containing protein [Solirubrobacteraceae bacterium]|nr:STAS domain-containing protein [Solirubrobacteraceae bacterium]